jgi:hypothetical protein
MKEAARMKENNKQKPTNRHEKDMKRNMPEEEQEWWEGIESVASDAKAGNVLGIDKRFGFLKSTVPPNPAEASLLKEYSGLLTTPSVMYRYYYLPPGYDKTRDGFTVHTVKVYEFAEKAQKPERGDEILTYEVKRSVNGISRACTPEEFAELCEACGIEPCPPQGAEVEKTLKAVKRDTNYLREREERKASHYAKGHDKRGKPLDAEDQKELNDKLMQELDSRVFTEREKHKKEQFRRTTKIYKDFIKEHSIINDTTGEPIKPQSLERRLQRWRKKNK